MINMSEATERTKRAEANMKKNWDKRLPVRVKEQDNKHTINQKIQKGQEVKALKRKITKRRGNG